MKHDELLTEINRRLEVALYNGDPQSIHALRSVVELHKPMNLPWGVTDLGCEGCGDMYPCKTINTIHNQLN